ncbi:MAG TPA: Fur family transcriptional regulator [Thermodesulfobacteriota bacterium]|nr:Fur family transcriptional regulator [Thermodesulfobacteriota bacterium]
MARADLTRIEQKLRARGLKVTPQRLAVARAVLASRGHPTADEIYRVVRRRFPSISLTTVYHTLDTLKALGEISELRLGDSSRYDPNRSAHDHLICRRCGGISDIARDREALPIPEALRQEYRVEDYQIQFIGYCKACRSS